MRKLKHDFKKKIHKQNNLDKYIKSLRRIHKRIQFLSNEIRRKDAREKIILGGLIVKAGLRDADKSFILGCLLYAAKLDHNSKEYKEFQKIGKQAFTDMRVGNDKQFRP